MHALSTTRSNSSLRGITDIRTNPSSLIHTITDTGLDFLALSSTVKQGIFLKRLKVPDGKGGLLGIKDFVCGKEILIFGHRFHIVSCDIFTRV